MPPEKTILSTMESWLSSLRTALQSEGCEVELVTHTSLLVERSGARVLVSLGLRVAPHETQPNDPALNGIHVELRARQYFVHGSCRLAVPGVLASCVKLERPATEVAAVLARAVSAEPVGPYAAALLKHL